MATKRSKRIPRKKSTEIVASYTGKISTGSYENEAPFFSIKEEWTDCNDEFVWERQKELARVCRKRFFEIEKKSQAEKIMKARQDVRFYDIDGEQFPSVTSITSWDKDFFIDPAELSQYAARGSIVHKQVELFLRTGKWSEPKDIPEIYPDYVIVKKGNLNLSLDDVDFKAFYEKHPFIAEVMEQTVYNKEHRYAGRYDIKGKFKDKITLFDIKTSSSINKTDYFKQLCAYAKCEGNEDVQQLCIIHLNKNTKQGYSAPIIETDVDKYWYLFLDDRKKFKMRFNV